MATRTPIASIEPAARLRTWLGLVLLTVGFFGHFFAAQAIGGSYIAYRDHLLGFVVLTLVLGTIIAALSWRFWKGRHDVTLLAIGALQAAIGVLVYVNRFGVHG